MSGETARPASDIPFGRPMIGEEERRAVAEVLSGPILVHGPRAKAFEEAFCAFTGAPHAVSVSSCTAAMHLAYLMLEIGEGDEVIVPAQTHVATAHAVEVCGAKPVFVDADPETGNMDVDAVAEAVGERTRAIAVVHYLGLPVDMDGVMEIARQNRLFVVEDCALAVGTRYRGTHAGLLGDVGCFSFYPGKHITTAEGGMLITRDGEVAEKISRLKAFGVDRTVAERTMPGIYDVTMLGINYRMNEMQAAMGVEQLKRVSGFLAARKRNYETLSQTLAGIEGIVLLRSSHGPFTSSYYCHAVVLDDALAPRRAAIVRNLRDRGVGTSVYYPKPIPHTQYYREKYGYAPGTFPGARRLSDRSIALPVGPHLTEDDMAYIAAAVKDAIAEASR